MASISSDGKVAYIYDQATDTWHPVAGAANTSADYDWSGEHNFGQLATFEQVLEAKAGVNNFQNPSARDTAIPSPANGTVVFIRQLDSGTTVNQIQFYNGTDWQSVNTTTFIAKSSSWTLSADDAGTTVAVTAGLGTTVVVTVPDNANVALPIGTSIEFVSTGPGTVEFSEENANVTIGSKYSNKKLAATYSAGVLIKTDTNNWILIGDLTS